MFVPLKAGKDDQRTEMDRLCKFIYTKDSTDRIRTRAILCHIYHHALHDRWYEARDLMLMSHLQDSVQHSDIPTQVHACRLHSLLQLVILFPYQNSACNILLHCVCCTGNNCCASYCRKLNETDVGPVQRILLLVYRCYKY